MSNDDTLRRLYEQQQAADTVHRKGASSLPWLLAGIGVLACLTAVTLASLHADPAKSNGVAGMPHGNSAHYSSTPHTSFPGTSAITPHLNLAANAASVSSGGTATLSTFTADDARVWVTAYLLPGYQTSGTVTIGSVTFVPQEQANQWANLGLALGLPADTPVCVVVLDTHHGSFTVPGSTGPATYSYVIFGFNGVTGNFMDTSWTNSLPATLAAAATPTTTTTPGTGASTPTS
jgi:hypothetical protein